MKRIVCSILLLVLAVLLLTAQQQNFVGGGGTLGKFASGTQTGAISANTLCSTSACPAGTYLVAVYLNETGTGCTTAGTGAAIPKLSFIDNQGVTRSTVAMPTASNGSTFVNSGMAFTTGGTNFGMALYVVNTNGSAVSGTDAIQILTTITACSTPGPWTGYQIRSFVVPLGS